MTGILMLATFVLAAMLWRLAAIDVQIRRLPDKYTLPLLVMGLVVNAYLDRGLPVAAITGAIAGFAVFWLIGTVYFNLRNVDGLGLGDAKLVAAAGAWLGVGWLPLLVLMAASGALAFALWRGQNTQHQLAFGPWLAGMFMLLWIKRLSELFG